MKIVRAKLLVLFGVAAPFGVAALTAAPLETCSAAEPSGAAAPVDYNRQIRPLLSNLCFRCHGPDANERQSGLRLDVRDQALEPAESGKRAIVPGKPEQSRLLDRIFSTDPGEVMPPPETNKTLSDADKELLKRWIAEGAQYREHWAFVPPRRPPEPPVTQRGWAKNAIDRFILARLEQSGLRPSPQADRATLIRRVTLDLTGLPPTPEEVRAFLEDRRDGAYERVVDRLLKSPHYGERMGVDWLDASRYADTHGYHIDSGRDMSRWREWVIGAFNRNLRFDQFTIEQLAGDLLPGATRDQLVASGFNRNHMINFEGGAIPEEYHTAYIVDRVNTTGTVWLGMSVGCAQCHDHKYDPISQRDFYGLFAFFHNVPENGLDGSKGNAAPLLRIPSDDEQRQLNEMATAIAGLEQKIAGDWPESDAAQVAWERTAAERPAWSVLQPSALQARGGAKFARQEDGAFLVTGENPAADSYEVTAPIDLPAITGVRLEALPDNSLPARGPGRSANGNLVLTDVRVARLNADPDAAPVPLKLRAASASFSQADFPVAKAIDGDSKSGWAIFPRVGEPHTAIFELEEPLRLERPQRLRVTLEFQSQFSQHQIGKFRLSITSANDPHGTAGIPDNVTQALAIPSKERDASQLAAVRAHFRSQVFPEGRQLHAEIDRLKKAHAGMDQSIGTTMVMQEMDRPRDTFLLIRGQYDKKGDQVRPAVPAALTPLPPQAPANRLGLAQWLVSPEHPLTARVTVNRFWQSLFGTGLVKTAEDFGSQGELPSHPELLDWLAVEFMSGQSAWDVKALVRLIVTSAAYQQSSVVSRDLLARDPENRLLARGPRFRLQAEFIRDQALAVSGLLDRRIGGKSVSPYQPAGLWEELMSRADGKNWTAQSYEQSHGPDLYRRTMYTFWKRTCPPPTLATFDAPDRETCTVRRARTNTPLQALVLLNDPTYVESARKFGERILREGGKTTDERLAFAFRAVLVRDPAPRELAVLRRMLEGELTRYRHHPEAAAKVLAVGEAPRDESLDQAELAAWTTIASAILNLDETVTRG